MQSSNASLTAPAARVISATKTNVRWLVVAVLFVITAINYADRATISLAGPEMAKELGFNSVTMGYIFSAFGWAYVIAQLPGGWLLDRFGSKRVYAFSIFLWSLFTLMVGAGRILHRRSPRSSCCSACASWWAPRKLRRFPQQPHRRRVVPGQRTRHRSGHLQLRPVLGNRHFRAADGLADPLVRLALGIRRHGRARDAVRARMEQARLRPEGPPAREQRRGVLHREGRRSRQHGPAEGGRLARGGPGPEVDGRLLRNRMLAGIYIAQYCINALTYFFITWFPVYLVKERRHDDPEGRASSRRFPRSADSSAACSAG